MPLLRRKPFLPEKPPSDLDPNEEILFCDLTGEVFRNYDAFYERVILCNSLLWTCERTGRSGLTYKEALESEDNVAKLLDAFPRPIATAVLNIVHHTRRSKLADLCDEIYEYLKCRYVEGEDIEFRRNDRWKKATISKSAVSINLNSVGSSGESPTKGKSPSPTKTPEKVLSNESVGSIKSPSSPIDNKDKWPDAKQMEYTVLLQDGGNSTTVKGKNVRREKGVFIKDTIRLFIRKTCVRSTASSDDGFWKVVDKFIDKYGLGPTSITGPLALSTPAKYKNKRKRHSEQSATDEATANEGSPKKKRKKNKHKLEKDKEGKKKKKETDPEKKKKKKEKEKGISKENKEPKKHKKKESDVPKQEPVAPKMTEEERRKLIEEMKLKRKLEREEERKRKFLEKEEDKKRKKIEKEKEKEKVGKVKELETRFLKKWNKQREDLKLEDLQKLPDLKTVQSKLPPELFGNILMVTEFLLAFGQFYEIEEYVQFQVSVDTVEEALVEHDVEGKYYEILKFLLQTFLRVSEEENDEEEDKDSSDGTDTPAEKEETEEKRPENSLLAPSVGATVAAAWPVLHQGQALSLLTMDSFTLSEILRLHVLSSGVKIGGALTLWQRRGGFQFSDDPCVHFRHKESELMKSLSSTCIYDLDPGWKLKILCLLCDQLLTLVTTRDYIEDAFDKIKELKKQLRELQFAEHRRRKTEAAERYKRRLNERAQVKEEILRRKKEKAEREGELARERAEGESGQPKQGKEKESVPNGDQIKEEPGNTVKAADEEPALTLVKLTDITKEEEDNEKEKRDEYKKKEREIMTELLKYSAINGESPLGRDRALNCYWALAGVDGFLVEGNNADVNLLLDGVENEDISEEESDNDEDDESLKEQEPEKTEEAPEVTTTTTKEDIVIKTESDTTLQETTLSEIIKSRENLSSTWPLLLNRYKCDSNLSELDVVAHSKTLEQVIKDVQCGVHPNIYSCNGMHGPQWLGFESKDQVQNLLSSLNERGVRESALKTKLKSNIDRICDSFEKTPTEDTPEVSTTPPKAKGSKIGDNIDKSLFRSMNDFLEANLRDQILDFEERLWTGSLGVLKVEDRDSWRKKIDEGIAKLISWDKTWGKKSANTSNNKDETPVANGHAEDMEVCTEGEEAMDTSLEGSEQKHFKPLVLKLKDCVNNDKQERCLTPTTVGTPTVNPVIKELGQALLQIEKGIEKKFLKPPLGEHEDRKKERIKEMFDAAKAEYDEMTAKAKQEKKKSKRQSNGPSKEALEASNPDRRGDQTSNAVDDDNESVSSEVSEDLKKERTCLERWETSLKSACNLSQLFIHLNTLDQSIMWNKSVLNARCRKCRRKGDAEQMLLCDGCDRGVHIYCLVPPIKQIPQGDWFCHDCRPKEPRRSARRRKPSRSAYESEEDEEEESEEEDNSEEDEESCEDDASTEDSDEEDDDDDDDNEDDETEDSSEEESEEEEEEDEAEQSEDDENGVSHHEDYCSVCGNGGTLLCCDSCSRAYHTSCSYPPMKKVPKGKWSCQVCTQAENELPRTKRVVTIEKLRAKEEVPSESSMKTRKSSRSKSVPQRVPKPRTPASEKGQPTSSQKRKRPQSVSPQILQPRKMRRGEKTEETKGSKVKSPPKSPTKSGKGVRKSATFSFGRYERRQCSKLLEELMQQDDAEPFLAPVDTKLVPDYRVYIDQPMDFGTIKRNINAAQYNTLDDFLYDVRLVFKNCETYNAPRSSIARAGTRLSLHFEQRLQQMELSN